MLFDISDPYEAWHVLELCWPSRLVAAQRLAIPVQRIVNSVSFNPFYSGPSLISHIRKVHVRFNAGSAFWCEDMQSI